MSFGRLAWISACASLTVACGGAAFTLDGAGAPSSFSDGGVEAATEADGASAIDTGVPGLSCTGAASCGIGTRCCISSRNNVVTSACKLDCGGGAQLCDPSATPTGCTQQTGACSTDHIGDFGLPPTYGTCGGRGN